MQTRLKKQIYQIFDKEKDSDLGEFALWKTLSKRVKNWKQFVYFSPHFHIIGNYYFLEEGKKEDPFVFKRINDFLPNRHQDQPEAIIKCSMYLLSHSGIHRAWNKQNTVWFGQLANNQWSIEKATEKIKRYVISTGKEKLNKFAEQVKETYKQCPDCKGDLKNIGRIFEDLNHFDYFTQRLLKYAYYKAGSGRPPPITIKELLLK